MKKFIILVLLISNCINVYSSKSPNEEKIYFHIHQATRWAELHYQNKTFFAAKKIVNHLTSIKFSEVNLVNSLFYEDFLFLNKLTRNMNKGNFSTIETFRADIHTKAEKNKIKHPENWEDEFILIR